MILKFDIAGSQTKTHCSASSGVGACPHLNTSSDRCQMFKVKLKYDYEAHAYERTPLCTSIDITPWLKEVHP